MEFSAADAAAHLGLDAKYLKFRQSILSSVEASAALILNVILNNVATLSSTDNYSLWCQMMTVIFKTMGLHKILGTGIKLSPFVSAEELISFQQAQRQGLLVPIQVVSKETFGEIAKSKIC
jgi:hypothetical protein